MVATSGRTRMEKEKTTTTGDDQAKEKLKAWIEELGFDVIDTTPSEDDDEE